MKNYNSLLEFIAGLVGVLIHSVIVIFMLSYVAFPEMLTVMIDATTGQEQQMLLTFVEDVSQIQPIIFVGTAIVIFEWVAIFKILRQENKLTPIWAAYLILGSLYAYFYFGGLEVFLLLFFAGALTLFKYFKHRKPQPIDEDLV